MNRPIRIESMWVFLKNERTKINEGGVHMIKKSKLITVASLSNILDQTTWPGLHEVIKSSHWSWNKNYVMRFFYQ